MPTETENVQLCRFSKLSWAKCVYVYTSTLTVGLEFIVDF